MSMGSLNDTVFVRESFIDFCFDDINTGLELTVECSRFTNGTLLDNEKLFPCEKPGVSFRFGEEGLEVRRAYKSPW